MDINTILKTMNGMAEKIEVLEDKLKNTGQFHLRINDAIHEKFSKCFNKFDKIDDRLEALEKDIKRLDNINSLNAERNNKFLDHFGSLGGSVHDLNKRCDKTESRIINLEVFITDKNSPTKEINKLNERCDDLVKVDNNIIECMDDLEVKNYMIKRDVDELTKNGETNE